MSGKLTTGLLSLWLATALIFAVAPGLDLWASGFFYDGTGTGFYLNGMPILQLLREAIWTAANLLAIVVIVCTLFSLLSRHPTGIPGRFWAFCLTLIVLGPGVLVNLILKNQWGRARPAELAEFGGSAQFTPPWQLTDQCASNCSFVSGEAAGAITAAIIVGLILWNIVPRRQRIWLLLACLCFAGLGSGLRVMTGRHFLSDVIWALVIMSSLAIWLGALFRIPDLLPRMTGPAFRRDAGMFQKTAGEVTVAASLLLTRRLSQLRRRPL